MAPSVIAHSMFCSRGEEVGAMLGVGIYMFSFPCCFVMCDTICLFVLSYSDGQSLHFSLCCCCGSAAFWHDRVER